MPNNFKYIVFIGLLIGVAVSCQKDQTEVYFYEVPSYFPQMHIPEDNAPTDIRVELGRHLFFDKGLSRDNTISCGTCHLPEKAFTDQLVKSKGIENRVTKRNSPTLLNVAYNSRFMFDGGAPTLELQVLAPIDEHTEFDFDIVLIAERLSANQQYQEWSREAYDRDLDPYVIMRSIAAFERSLLSFQSPFDQYYYQGDENAISESAKNGWELFKTREIGCINCHAPPLFTNSNFYHIGLEDLGDEGRRRVTGMEEDRGKFKTPTLRNLSYTFPYMHDGRFETLEEVVEHFNSGGVEHPNKDTRIVPLELSEEEKNDIIAFLNSLNDDSFKYKEEYQNPQK